MFRIFPDDDHNQTLRLKRFFMALGSYLMWFTICVLFYSQGLMTRAGIKTLFASSLGILFCNVLIYALIRSGYNKKLKDPSLTLLQMVIATFWVMVIAYYADSMRSLVLLTYLVVFIFGLFRLNVWQFLFLSAFAVVNYSLVILLLYKINPELVSKVDILNIVILAMVLPWFSLVGGYITRLRAQISHALSTIEKLAIIDDLTQVFNRRQMYKILEHQKALVDRGIHPFSICIFDLDHFKRVNDTFGHTAGDIVLKTVAQETQANLRNIDHIARYGGEEFILILTNSDKNQAAICAERIRKKIKDLVFEKMPSDFRITISVGVTEYQSNEVIEEAINRADTALYRAKANGRDRVEYEPLTPA
ncbi:MAG: GGDEF domain-containing protein [Deltaproteobacteria bacterium]|nr:GGDEF domain-containing protein [Deltaproteobacteria bacterium]